DDGSAIRVRALDQPNGVGTPADGEVLLALAISPEPKLRLQRTVAVRVAKATDDQGQSLEQVMPADEGPGGVVAGALPLAPGRVVAGAVVGGPGAAGQIAQGRVTPVRLKKGPNAATALTTISGTITAQMLKEPQ